MEKDFYDFKWNLPFKCRVREFEDALWENRFDLFHSLEYFTNKNVLEHHSEGIRTDFEDSR